MVAFLWLGWSGNRRSVPWIVPTLSGIVQGIGSVLIFVSADEFARFTSKNLPDNRRRSQRSLQTYLIDAYERYSASALASNVVARSISGQSACLTAMAPNRDKLMR